jgi:transposase InsO family protein
MPSVSVEIGTKQADQNSPLHHSFVYTHGGSQHRHNRPCDKESADNCYILVIIDCFSRFVELYPVSDTSAIPCARRALLSHVCKYGTPMTIRSDRGTQVVNGIISQLLSLLQIDHELSLVYSKEQNSIVERANKEVMRHLTAIIFDRRVSEVWSSEYLPLVQRIMNAKVHDTIGVSPAELVFEKSINLYTGLLLPIPPESLIKGTADVTEHRHVARLIKV